MGIQFYLIIKVQRPTASGIYRPLSGFQPSGHHQGSRVRRDLGPHRTEDLQPCVNSFPSYTLIIAHLYQMRKCIYVYVQNFTPKGLFCVT